jgi:hypothetical protein
MKFYRYQPDADLFAGIGVSLDKHDLIVRIHYDDRPLLHQWEPLQVHGFDDNPEEEGDFPSMSSYFSVPVMSARAWNSLRPLIGYCCEALPIIYPSGRPFFIIHVMETIDCLDQQRSQYTVNEVPPYRRISRIDRYAFKASMLRNKHIFKLPVESGGELIVDDEFRKAVEQNGLKGLEFKELPMVA